MRAQKQPGKGRYHWRPSRELRLPAFALIPVSLLGIYPRKTKTYVVTKTDA